MQAQLSLCRSFIGMQYDMYMYHKACKHYIIWAIHVTHRICGKSSFKHECAAIQWGHARPPQVWSVYLLLYLKALNWLVLFAGFYRKQYPASYTHKSLGRTRKFTLPASAGTQMCLLCLSLKSQIPKLFRNNSGFPIFAGYL